MKKKLKETLEETIPMIDFFQGKNIDKEFSFHLAYQTWYTKAIKIYIN